MACLCAYQGGRIALCGFLYGRATTRGWPRTVVFFLAFAASELLYPLLFPWYFAASVHQVPALTQLAEFGGPYLVGLVLAASSLAIAEIVVARWHKRPLAIRWVAAGLLTPVLAALFGYVRLRQIDARALASEPVHVGLVQGNMPLVQSRDDHAESLRRHLRMTEELRQKGADFAVWSESAVMWSIPEDDYDKFLQHLFTRRLKIPALFGALLVARDSDHFRAYNVALASDRRWTRGGALRQALSTWRSASTSRSARRFPACTIGRRTPGTSRRALRSSRSRLAGHPVTALVCYEDILPRFVNGAMNHGDPEMIVNVTNDAWFGDTTEPWIHLALARDARGRAPPLPLALHQQRRERGYRSGRPGHRPQRSARGSRGARSLGGGRASPGAGGHDCALHERPADRLRDLGRHAVVDRHAGDCSDGGLLGATDAGAGVSPRRA